MTKTALHSGLGETTRLRGERKKRSFQSRVLKSFLFLLTLSVSQTALSRPVYIPLEVGTRWHYYNTMPLSSYKPIAPNEVIKDTVMSNGKKYAVITLDNSNEREYQRAQNDSVFEYSIYAHQETLLFRFNAAEKDTVITTIRGNDTTDVILTDTTIQTVFGRPLRVFTFLVDVRHVFDDERTIRIADSIGIIRTEQGPEYRIGLGGAVIGGVTYGTIQTFAQRYYPLTVGNQWFYDSTTHPFTVKVMSDSLFPNGLHYGVLSRNDPADGQFVRTDSHFVYYYEPSRVKEYATFKLDGARGDTTSSDDGFRRSIITAIDTVMMFGEQTRLIHYRLYETLAQKDVVLSDKFGPVSVGYYADPPAPWPEGILNAAGCIIDGWRYGLVTSVRRGTSSPGEFMLSQNYPNPFNPSTTISYRVPTRAHVVIRIFNAIGQLVATLVDETKGEGTYTAVWNAARFSSGVYFYQMRAGAFVQTKRLAIVK